jgi:DNA-binding response OmpR family regulator
METIRLLFVEDNPVDALSLKKALEQTKGAKFAISHVETLAEAKKGLEKEDFHVVVLDLGLPDSQGIETFVQVQNFAPGHPHSSNFRA